jgi:hypothetical protein
MNKYAPMLIFFDIHNQVSIKLALPFGKKPALVEIDSFSHN